MNPSDLYPTEIGCLESPTLQALHYKKEYLENVDQLFAAEMELSANSNDPILNNFLIEEQQKIIGDFIASLPPREKLVMRKSFYENFSLAKIGDILKISKVSVHKLLRKIYKKAKRNSVLLALL